MDPHHITRKEAQWRKFKISKSKLHICKHVERTISDGMNKKVHNIPKNVTDLDKLEAHQLKIDHINTLNDKIRQGFNLKLGVNKGLDRNCSRASFENLPSVYQSLNTKSRLRLSIQEKFGGSKILNANLPNTSNSINQNSF